MSENMKQETSMDKHTTISKTRKEMEITRSTKGLDAYVHTVEFFILVIMLLCYVKGTLVNQGNVNLGNGQRNMYIMQTKNYMNFYPEYNIHELWNQPGAWNYGPEEYR